MYGWEGEATAQVVGTSHSPWRSGFSLSPVHVGFVLPKVALGQVSLPVLQFSPVHMIQPIPYTHLVMHHWSYIGPAIDNIKNKTLKKIKWGTKTLIDTKQEK
jgi:hypothetical protein